MSGPIRRQWRRLAAMSCAIFCISWAYGYFGGPLSAGEELMFLFLACLLATPIIVGLSKGGSGR